MSKTPLEIPTPTIQEIEAAHRAFEESEPRDLFYRAATELMGLALRGKTPLSVTEALAVLLQTWNRAFYRFTLFDSWHCAKLEHAVTSNQKALASFRERSIESFSNHVWDGLEAPYTHRCRAGRGCHICVASSGPASECSPTSALMLSRQAYPSSRSSGAIQSKSNSV